MAPAEGKAHAMAGSFPLLLIGDPALRATVAQALPEADVCAQDSLLDGVWQFAHGSFDRVLVAAARCTRGPTAVQALRQIAPAARIVITCSAGAEPRVRGLLRAGADEYILEPLTREDLMDALRWQPEQTSSGAAAQPLDQFVQLAELLGQLHQGPQFTLGRIAELLCRAFDAQGATVEFDGQSAAAGALAQPALEQPIEHNGRPAGCICIGPPRQGAHAPDAAARLREYARLTALYVERSREQEHWRTLAWTDYLTGLHNRRYFEHALDELLARARAQRLRVTVLLFDIDGFKDYNDRLGHEVGDGVLRELADLLRRCSRKEDLLARYGGDEFAVVFWDAQQPRVAGSVHPTEPAALVERFSRALREHQFACLGAGAPGTVTISGGLASFPWDGANRQELLRAADEALLLAKRAGKNRILLTSEAGRSDPPLRDGQAPPPGA